MESARTSEESPDWPDALLWWIDAVGGYLTFLQPTVRIGHIGERSNDVAILGDLSSRHAEIQRADQGHLLIAHSETTVNDRPGSRFLLKDGDHLRMRTVEWIYRQPVRWSTTARLSLMSQHRLPRGLDGIVLLGRTCLLGPGTDAHLPTDWDTKVYLTWGAGGYWVRGDEPLTVDGRIESGWTRLGPRSEVEGPWGSFRWRPV